MEAELVNVPNDLAIAKFKCGVNDVVDRPAGRAKAVPSLPMGATGMDIGLHVPEFDFEISAFFAEHPPHSAGGSPVQVREHRVGEPDIGVVTVGHGRAVAFLERRVEAVNQGFMGVHGSPPVMESGPRRRFGDRLRPIAAQPSSTDIGWRPRMPG